MKKNKVVLAILDGFGLGAQNKDNNAIYAANTPFFDQFWFTNKMAQLSASEEDVGLKKGQFGNSEHGHMTIGAGRKILTIEQTFNELVDSKKINEFLLELDFIKRALKQDKPIHLVGLFSDGCVHSDRKQFITIINFFQQHGKKIALHLFSDGRDTAPNIFENDLNELSKILLPTSKIVSISGRYYAMDRDKNFDRIELAFNAMMQRRLVDCDPITYVKSEYKNKHDDEFLVPASFCSDQEYLIKNDSFIFFLNYRADRIRQLIHCFKQLPIFKYISSLDDDVKIFGMCDYPDTNLDGVIIQKQELNQTLSQILSNHNIRQLHIAETEKFAHVTYFFNGGKNEKYPLEEDILIPSPKIISYDLKPEMSALEITNTVENKIDDFDFILINYANADMVGHTGNFAATKKAIEILDKQCAILYNLLQKYNGTLIITSDHGNADQMLDTNSHEIVKTHSVAKVPLFVLSNEFKLLKFEGSLQDIAPSILYLFSIDKDVKMDGNNLLIRV